MRRVLAAVAVVALAGCSGAVAPSPATPPVVSPVPAPADGVLLTSLGFRHAPADFSVPSGAAVSERVDQTNTVAATFTAPSGLEFAAYLRRELPERGWRITDDANNSLLFERDGVRGAFTVTGPTAALALRYDAQS